MKTARTSESPVQLLMRTLGTPQEVVQKVRRLARAISRLTDGKTVPQRLARLHTLGYVEQVPTTVQLVVGSIDMVRFWIVPAAKDYYDSQGINLTFHQVLRVLDDPASMVDPVGFLSERDVIIGHLLQVVHGNPEYDLQLLDAHEDGLAELESQTRAMIAGTHPRAKSIGAIVEDPGYHSRLLDYTVAFRRDPNALAPVRENVQNSPRLQELERTFGNVTTAMRYFAGLPKTALRGVIHVLQVREFVS